MDEASSGALGDMGQGPEELPFKEVIKLLKKSAATEGKGSLLAQLKIEARNPQKILFGLVKRAVYGQFESALVFRYIEEYGLWKGLAPTATEWLRRLGSDVVDLVKSGNRSTLKQNHINEIRAKWGQDWYERLPIQIRPLKCDGHDRCDRPEDLSGNIIQAIVQGVRKKESFDQSHEKWMNRMNQRRQKKDRSERRNLSTQLYLTLHDFGLERKQRKQGEEANAVNGSESCGSHGNQETNTASIPTPLCASNQRPNTRVVASEPSSVSKGTKSLAGGVTETSLLETKSPRVLRNKVPGSDFSKRVRSSSNSSEAEHTRSSKRLRGSTAVQKDQRDICQTVPTAVFAYTTSDIVATAHHSPSGSSLTQSYVANDVSYDIADDIVVESPTYRRHAEQSSSSLALTAGEVTEGFSVDQIDGTEDIHDAVFSAPTIADEVDMSTVKVEMIKHQPRQDLDEGDSGNEFEEISSKKVPGQVVYAEGLLRKHNIASGQPLVDGVSAFSTEMVVSIEKHNAPLPGNTTTKPNADTFENGDVQVTAEKMSGNDGGANETISDIASNADVSFVREKNNVSYQRRPTNLWEKFELEALKSLGDGECVGGYAINSILAICGIWKEWYIVWTDFTHATVLEAWRSEQNIIMPLHLEGVKHWTLAIINVRARQVYIYDPLRSEDYIRQSENIVRSRLEMLLEPKGPWTYVKAQSTDPQQTNSFDCGIYILVFALYKIHNNALPNVIRPLLWRRFFRSILLPRSSELPDVVHAMRVYNLAYLEGQLASLTDTSAMDLDHDLDEELKARHLSRDLSTAVNTISALIKDKETHFLYTVRQPLQIMAKILNASISNSAASHSNQEKLADRINRVKDCIGLIPDGFDDDLRRAYATEVKNCNLAPKPLSHHRLESLQRIRQQISAWDAAAVKIHNHLDRMNARL